SFQLSHLWFLRFLLRPWDHWRSAYFRARLFPTNGQYRCPPPSRRSTKRRQNATRRIVNAEVRLEGNAALGHSREPLVGGKRDSLSRSNRMGAVSLTDHCGLCCASGTGRVGWLAVL